MKKLTLLLISLVLILSMFATFAVAESKIKITVWDGFRWPNEEGDKYHWIKSCIVKFEELHPEVEIELVEVAWEKLGEKMNIAIAGHDWPDIGPVDISDGAVNLKYVEQGVIEPLDSFFTEEELNDFFPAALNAYSYKGHLYGIPTSMTVHALMLNLDIFEERGVEPPVDGKWTWNEFAAKMKKLTFDRDGDGNIDVYGFSTYILKGYYEAWPFLMMDGGKPLSADNTEYTFDSPEAISGLTKFASLKFNHKVCPMEMGGADVGGCFQAFANPEKRFIAVEPWASWAIATLRTSKKYEMNFMVAEYPIGKTGEPITIGGSGGFVVFKQKNAEKLKIVTELAKFLSNAEQQYTFAVNYGTFPALKSAQAMDPFKDNPQMRRAAEMLEYTVSLPRHSSWSQIDERIQAQLQLVLNGEKTAREALKTAGEQVQKFLK